jgi:hypothetical protein
LKDAHLSVDDTIRINNENYLHIQKVEVFTGDDDYNETDCVEVSSHKEQLLIKQLLTRKSKPSSHRLRGEPSVRLFLDSEDGKKYILTVAHHKGSIHVSAKEISHEMV